METRTEANASEVDDRNSTTPVHAGKEPTEVTDDDLEGVTGGVNLTWDSEW